MHRNRNGVAPRGISPVAHLHSFRLTDADKRSNSAIRDGHFRECAFDAAPSAN